MGDNLTRTKSKKTKITLKMRRGSDLPLNAIIFLLLRSMFQKHMRLRFREERKKKRAEWGLLDFKNK